MNYEETRRAFASSIFRQAIFRQAWRLHRRSVLSFPDCLSLSWSLTRGFKRLCYTKCRGTTKANDDGINRQRILVALASFPESEVILNFERESSNIFDSNAIKVMSSVFVKKDNGECAFQKCSACVGYLSADLAKQVAPLMDQNYEIAAFFLGITGIGKQNLGINFCFTILPIPAYHNKQKSPQLAS